MARRHGVKGFAAKAHAQDKRVRKALGMPTSTALEQAATVDTGMPTGSHMRPVAMTKDSFQNFLAKMGIGTDNQTSAGTYGFNPITRMRVLLEWMHRGSWIAGAAVDIIAKDMTRAGITLKGQVEPEAIEKIERTATALQIWPKLCQTVQWGRLYGGALAVMLIEGQPMDTPLRLDTIGVDQFKGLLVLDRWMVDPSLENLVTEFGPDLGLPKYYRVLSNAPALPRTSIHYSRVIRVEGNDIPYQQRLMENLWTTSVLERIYDRMLAFDSATAGGAQLVHKSYLRTLKIMNFRELVSAGGDAETKLAHYVQTMARFAGIEGVTCIDAEDELEAQTTTAFSGLSDALSQFGQQISGALEIPLVRLFGQSPSGFNSGEGEERQYGDGINQKQEVQLRPGATRVYDALARSCGTPLGDDFSIAFKPLVQLSEKDKSEIASTDVKTINEAEGAGLISPQTALKELKQSSHTTGRFTNITDEDIEAADDEPQVPEAPTGEVDPLTGKPKLAPSGEAEDAGASGEPSAAPAKPKLVVSK